MSSESWIVFDRAVVTSRVPEIEADVGNTFDASAGDARPEPIDQIIEATVREVRAAVAGCSRNRLDADARKIPHSLVNDACSLVSYYFATRMPGAAGVVAEDPRYQAFREAKEKLRRVSACEVAVEDGATGELVGGNGASVDICVPPAEAPRMTRRSFFGI